MRMHMRVSAWACVCVYVHACVRACVRVCVRACVRACVCVCVYTPSGVGVGMGNMLVMLGSSSGGI